MFNVHGISWELGNIELDSSSSWASSWTSSWIFFFTFRENDNCISPNLFCCGASEPEPNLHMGEFYLKPLFTAAVGLHCGRARSEMLSNLFVGCASTTPCGNF
jgi:hypothetical protein